MSLGDHHRSSHHDCQPAGNFSRFSLIRCDDPAAGPAARSGTWLRLMDGYKARGPPPAPWPADRASAGTTPRYVVPTENLVLCDGSSGWATGMRDARVPIGTGSSGGASSD